ncbi:hypothetical protein [uncultured Kiloniella sp.]|uniref:hypothetical protein n=1 Tax=uncultured Kiloniella sp. TaxID=1133091 RepID=UPI0026030A5F|nr:hypothetical protein [uncultured Kiloniella sp.]
MKNVLKYKGYIGSIFFSEEDGVYHGKVEFIRDLVNYEASEVDALEASFHEAVDDYLEMWVGGN